MNNRGMANYRGEILLKEAYSVQRELVLIIKDFCKEINATLEEKILLMHRTKLMNHDQRWKLLKKLRVNRAELEVLKNEIPNN